MTDEEFLALKAKAQGPDATPADQQTFREAKQSMRLIRIAERPLKRATVRAEPVQASANTTP